jgi:hypothetical protein
MDELTIWNCCGDLEMASLVASSGPMPPLNSNSDCGTLKSDMRLKQDW